MSAASATTKEVLWDHIQTADICPGTETLDQWLSVRWFRVRIGTWAVPMLPIIGYRRSLILHDIHHLVTGYDTTNKGEMEIAAWEIASGGCGRSLFFWLIQLGALLLGLVVCPLRTSAALGTGWHQRNLYRRDPDQLLAMDYKEVVSMVRRCT